MNFIRKESTVSFTIYSTHDILNQILSPRGEFLKELEEGSLWFEASLLPWVIKNFFLTPVGPIKKLDFIVRTGGRTGGRVDGRAGVFSFC